MSLLKRISHSDNVKALDSKELPILAEEIRNEIIEVISKNGGHIGPNLGVVELTIAMHRVFSTPKDKFTFDVAHQGYVHKLLTGRQGEKFKKIRKSGGLSGFLDRSESPHDAYGAGHAGTALSAALGMATARDQKGTDEHVVAVVGDAAFTCGITMEALNNVTACTKNLTVILNDNEWSIAPNVGAISKYFNQLITQPAYSMLNEKAKELLKKMPGGESLRKIGSKAKKETKDFIVPSNSSLFETYGLRYIGPIDGHNVEELVQYLEVCKHSKQPVLLHVLTTKGKGYPGALEDPEKFHGPGPFDIKTGKSVPAKPGTPPKYQDVFGESLLKLAKQDKSILAITAATPLGSGLSKFSKELPNQFYDVGIAEEHAVLFAAGLATQGLKPVCAIYSTFLQRAFDPIVHDICLQKLPVVFCMDRAGLSANDGPTHHGLFDISYLRCVPNAIAMQPKDEDELADMLYTSMDAKLPCFIRYPRGAAMGTPMKETPEKIKIGQAEVLKEGNDIVIWALGPFVPQAQELANKISLEHTIGVGVVNARFIKPLDKHLLCKQAKNTKLFVTMEDHVLAGGFGSAIVEELQETGIQVPVERIGWPDQFIPHGSSDAQLRGDHGLSPETIEEKIIARWKLVNGDTLPSEEALAEI